MPFSFRSSYNHTFHNIQERQSQLFAKYFFKCNCEACCKNYETFFTLEAKDKNTAIKYAMEAISGLSIESLQKSSQKYEDACKYIDKNYKKNYPCKEMISAQIIMLQCLQNFTYKDYWNGKAVKIELL